MMKIGDVVRLAQDGPKNTHGVYVGSNPPVGPYEIVVVRIESATQVADHVFTWELTVLPKEGTSMAHSQMTSSRRCSMSILERRDCGSRAWTVSR